MFRHGVRSWLQTYPGEPLDVSIWNSEGGLGVLTNAGVKQMTEFGQYFANYYQDLIQFDPSKTYVRTTDYNRTMTSAKKFLYGLFSNNDIAINTLNRKKDYVRQFYLINLILYHLMLIQLTIDIAC